MPLLEEALHIRRTNSLDARVPETLVALAEALEDSQTEQATKLADEAVERARDLRVRRPLALALGATGRIHRRRADLEEALDLADRLGDLRLRDALSHRLEQLGEI